MKSNLGLIFAAAFIVLATYLIATQGLLGESFIAITLGLPWSLVPVYFEYGNGSEMETMILLLIPIVMNTYIFYWIGSRVNRPYRY